jgi:isopentenyl phosphate kinase
MTERDCEQALINLLEAVQERDVLDVISDDEIAANVAHVNSFDDVGMATRNKGVVMRMTSGDEFQLCIVQSRIGGES